MRWFLVLALALLVAYEKKMAHNNRPSLIAHDKELLAMPDMLAHENPETKRRIPKLIDGPEAIIEVTGQARGMKNH